MSEIYSIGSGKGGVGKSFITASLGALIARHGKKVALIDLDLGASNLHTFIGIKNPHKGIHQFLNKTANTLDSVTVSTHINNLFFIGSSHCSMEIANLHYAQKVKLIKAVKKLTYDYILIDLGAGTNFNTLDFFLISNKGIVVFMPEPTSIENSFRFIKAVYLRRLKQIIKSHAFNARIKEAIEEIGRNSAHSQDIIETLLRYNPESEDILKESLNKFHFKILLNQFRKNADINLGMKIETVCNKHFYSPFEFLGNVSFDEHVHEAIFKKKLFIKEYPDSTTVEELKKLLI